MDGFDKVRGRFLVSWLLMAIAISIAVTLGVEPDWGETLDPAAPPDPTPDALFGLVLAALLIAVPLARSHAAGLRVQRLYPSFPRHPFRLAALAFPMVGIAFIGLYVFFAPLSVVAPDLVQAWLFEDQPVFYARSEPIPWLGNLLAFLAIVVAAPVSEEWLFRGLLFNRWSRKWSVRTGVILSSALFAVLHTDLIGAFVFGVVMCGLYARTGSLWAPTLVHAANNALAWLLAVLDAHGVIPAELETVSQLQEAWWLPVLGVLLVLPWARRGWQERPSSWTLPSHPVPDRAATP